MTGTMMSTTDSAKGTGWSPLMLRPGRGAVLEASGSSTAATASKGSGREGGGGEGRRESQSCLLFIHKLEGEGRAECVGMGVRHVQHCRGVRGCSDADVSAVVRSAVRVRVRGTKHSKTGYAFRGSGLCTGCWGGMTGISPPWWQMCGTADTTLVVWLAVCPGKVPDTLLVVLVSATVGPVCEVLTSRQGEEEEVSNAEAS